MNWESQKHRYQVLAQAFEDTLPVAMGYVPLGAAYGLLLVHAGIDWYWAPLMSLFVFAGALQFISAHFLALGIPLWEVALTTLLINFRHIFYGLSFPYSKLESVFARWYGIFALTDETYSLLAHKQKEELSENRIVLIQLLSHGYWILGSLVGASVVIPTKIKGVEFTLTALFIVLVQEHGYKKKNYPFLVMAGISSLLAFTLAREQFLSVAMGCFVALLSLNYLMRKK